MDQRHPSTPDRKRTRAASPYVLVVLLGLVLRSLALGTYTGQRVGASNGNTSTRTNWVSVAAIRSDDASGVIVQKALAAAKIPAIIGGSLVYGVRVPKRDQERAIRILRDDARRHGYWIRCNWSGPPGPPILGGECWARGCA